MLIAATIQKQHSQAGAMIRCISHIVPCNYIAMMLPTAHRDVRTNTHTHISVLIVMYTHMHQHKPLQAEER